MVPGGAKTFCNDFCVNMCVYGDVDCELESCLDSCNTRLVNDENDNEFDELPAPETDDEFPMVDFGGDEMVDSEDGEEEASPEEDGGNNVQPVAVFVVDETEVEPEVEDNDSHVQPVAVFTVPKPDSEELLAMEEAVGSADEPAPEETLNLMQLSIEKAVDELKEARATYENLCAEDPSQLGCGTRKDAIKRMICGVKEQRNAYDAYAISYELDIRVEVWMVDIDEITAEP